MTHWAWRWLLVFSEVKRKFEDAGSPAKSSASDYQAGAELEHSFCIWEKFEEISRVTPNLGINKLSTHSCNELSHLALHYSNVSMSMMAYQITSLMIVFSTIYSGTDQRKHQSFMSLAFVRRIQRWPMNSLHKGPVMRKMFPYDNVIMRWTSPFALQRLYNFCGLFC